jgi:hypothetical protein
MPEKRFHPIISVSRIFCVLKLIIDINVEVFFTRFIFFELANGIFRWDCYSTAYTPDFSATIHKFSSRSSSFLSGFFLSLETFKFSIQFKREKEFFGIYFWKRRQPTFTC